MVLTVVPVGWVVLSMKTRRMAKFWLEINPPRKLHMETIRDERSMSSQGNLLIATENTKKELQEIIVSSGDRLSLRAYHKLLWVCSEDGNCTQEHTRWFALLLGISVHSFSLGLIFGIMLSELFTSFHIQFTNTLCWFFSPSVSQICPLHSFPFSHHVFSSQIHQCLSI